MNILVSACLLGVNCRYSGKGELCQELQKLMKEHHLIPVCPEQLGGLATPRTPAERVKDRVVTQMGEDVTAQYEKGARETAGLAELFGCRCAVLKERSPSCGNGRIYEGTRAKQRTKKRHPILASGLCRSGRGIFSRRLRLLYLFRPGLPVGIFSQYDD